jgi:GntR family transcriptional regulator
MDMHRWISISQADPRPLYIQVIDQVKRRVSAGDLLPGAELPSIRQLAAELQISVITVKRAYLELERDGVILTRQGKGSFVADQPGLAAELLDREMRDLLTRAVVAGRLLGKSKLELSLLLDDLYEQNLKGNS